MTSSPSLPPSHLGRPSTFLSLAPTTSASYPVQRPTSLSAPKIPAAADAAADITTASSTTMLSTEAVAPSLVTPAAAAAAAGEVVEAAPLALRRSSSLSSDESGSKHRFLKLGPVHGGEGNGSGDWSEVGVAE